MLFTAPNNQGKALQRPLLGSAAVASVYFVVKMQVFSNLNLKLQPQNARMELGLHRKLILFLAPCTEAAASAEYFSILPLEQVGSGQKKKKKMKKITGTGQV